MFLANAFFETIGNFWVEHTSQIISTLVIIAVTIFLFVLVRFITKRYIKKQDAKRKHAISLAKMLLNVFGNFDVIVSIIVILGVWGVNVLPVLITVGIVFIAFCIGAYKLIRDVISGICIVFEDYFDIGDVVEINGFKGTVREIGIRSTKLINWKNEVRMFANGDINAVTNYSKYPSVGVVEIKISYKEDIKHVVELLENDLRNLKEVYSQILEGPNVVGGVIGLDDNGVAIRITVKTESEKHYEVERIIKQRVKEIFDKEGIEIPYPQMVIRNEDSNKL